ncbi:hypothetical protein [Chryseobacterium jejuense]|uniref:Carboxypeptidase regulatory-like domain-containing protein n=1 Tax=Chryseobacterium jejuense TaxID=445960 RepID=A0A2X2VLR9_CHRJE|nr:hypothetical protein [Chryseobacterium jejuense]SDI80903.1 hypothetical protein SAMN05421542_1872 [Chryseobacterium jejuense]SQB27767.1 Uncharacterised protein [Chryseobacterium jejuense]
MKQTIGKLLIIALVIVSLASVYFFIYYYSSQDVNDVKVEGYVLDSSNSRPLRDVKVTVVNDRYESNNGHKNYDEYLGQDKIQLKTDDKGYYSTILKKSAYVYIYIEKDGYKSIEEKGQHAQKLIVFKTNMDRLK